MKVYGLFVLYVYQAEMIFKYKIKFITLLVSSYFIN